MLFRSALQAMACGCIVVTSDLGALKETMNGMNSYVDINTYNFDINKYIVDFINKLEQNMVMPETVKEHLRQTNRNYIKMNYTWSVVCERFENDMNSMLKEYKEYMTKYKDNLVEAVKLFAEGKFPESFKLFSVINIFNTLYEYYIVRLNMVCVCFSLKT